MCDLTNHCRQARRNEIVKIASSPTSGRACSPQNRSFVPVTG